MEFVTSATVGCDYAMALQCEGWWDVTVSLWMREGGIA